MIKNKFVTILLFLETICQKCIWGVKIQKFAQYLETVLNILKLTPNILTTHNP
jgi:hypothetical protein